MAPLYTLTALLLSISTLCLAEIISLKAGLGSEVTDLSSRVGRSRIHEAHQFGSDGEFSNVELLNIVLLASVDGKLHAVNRSTGNIIWSMASAAGTAPATLGPLVRTEHPDLDPDIVDDDSPHKEVYAIEPQSGDIYVMSTSDSPLQRLPFSMSQLVEMSPYVYPGDDDNRFFIGKKETSLLVLDLESGRVRVLNSECPWHPFADMDPTQADIDLDELDGTKPPKSAPTEVYIGRTGTVPTILLAVRILTFGKTTLYLSVHHLRL